MSTNNICFYKEADKSTQSYSLKTMKLLNCALIRVCVVLKSNTVNTLVIFFFFFRR